MNDACTVNINGEDWYIPCDRVNDIGLDQQGNLVVLTSSSLTLYKTFQESTQNTYPRVACNFGRICYIQEQAQDYQYLRNAYLVVGNRSITDDVFSTYMLGIIAVGVLLWTFFKH